MSYVALHIGRPAHAENRNNHRVKPIMPTVAVVGRPLIPNCRIGADANPKVATKPAIAIPRSTSPARPTSWVRAGS